MKFAHEKLIVYQRALAFIAWSQDLLESISKGTSAKNQLERAPNSILLNLAEGNAKFSKKDRARFFQIAHASAVECAACLDILVARKLKSETEIIPGKEILAEIVKMTLGLLSKNESFLVEEESGLYGLSGCREEKVEVEEDA